MLFMIAFPAIDGGYRIIFERDISIDMKVIDEKLLQMAGQDISSRELLTVKIL